MGILSELKKSSGLTDLTTMKLTMDKVYSKAVMEEKAMKVAEVSGAAIAYYSASGRKLELITSVELKERLNRLTPGTKVRWEVKDDKGKVIDSMTQHGVIAPGQRCSICAERPPSGWTSAMARRHTMPSAFIE